MSSALILAEHAHGRPTVTTLELLGLARGLACASGGAVSALVFGAAVEVERALIAHGADRVYVAGDRGAEGGSEARLAQAERAARASGVTLILACHTSQGADLAPRLAFRLRSAAVTGCVAVEAGDDGLLFTRPCYGGNARETVRLKTLPAVASVRAGHGDALAADPARAGETVVLDPAPVSRGRVVERRTDSAGEVRLEDARVIVSGGRGLGGPEGFPVLADLAGALGGVVGASRVPCDLGWCPHAMQIGLTGKSVTPELYVAVGISGAGHHMAGCGSAKTIVAINTDPEAAIFQDARFGIVGDYQQVVPALAAEVRKLRN